LSFFKAVVYNSNSTLNINTNKRELGNIMHGNVFSELSLIIAVAAAIAGFMRLIKQPLIIGHILTGVIVGPALLGIVKNAETMQTFSQIGIALLLFVIGLGLNPQVVKEVGKVALTAGLVQILSSVYVGFCIALLFGWTKTEALFVGAALAFSSTIIILKLISDKKEQSRLYGKITIGILLVQDIFATLALLVVAAKGQSGGISPTTLGLLLVKGFLIAVPMFFISTKIIPKMHKLIAGSQEFLFLFAIGWGFASAALFLKAGFSLEIGALLGGVSLANLPYAQEVASRLRPLRDFFVIVFFISLGSGLTISSIGGSLPLIAVLTVLTILFKPFMVLITLGLMGYTKRTAFLSASSLAQLSEFSLVLCIVGNTSGIIRGPIVTIVTMTTLLTIAISTYLIQYSDAIFRVIEPSLKLFEQHKVKREFNNTQKYDLALFGYSRGAHEFEKVFKSLGKKYVIIDYDPEVIELLDTKHANFIYGDATDAELLDEIGFDKMKLVVSTITDHQSNMLLVKKLESLNPSCVVVCHADNPSEAAGLYNEGASYVMMPHYIGSEKIGAFIKKNGLKKAEFKKYREKHLHYIQSYLGN
jgi:Kef-type K+ transport system membrane component KefB